MSQPVRREITREEWLELESVIDAVLDTEPGRRAGYVEELCSRNPALRPHLSRLLAELERGDSLIDGAAMERFALLLETDGNELPRLGDRFAVEREIGRGGMATVFLAQDRKHDRPVAIKVLRREIAATIGAERFFREIRTAASLQHPHIMPLHDSGEADGLLYYVMPYGQGESLRERLTRDQNLSIEESLRIGRDIAGALDHAHANGIVHRDIKPENIFLSAGHALVMDFGIARAISSMSDDSSRTSPGLAVGTPNYMSPEQAAADPVIDGRSDIYSLGCVLYEMLTGRPPFRGSSVQETLAHHFRDPVPSARAHRRDVPEAVDSAISKALSKSPDARFSTAGAFIDACADRNVHVAGLQQLTRPGIAAISLGVALLVLLISLSTRSRAPASAPLAERPSIAVLPFRNLDRDSISEAMSDGISEEIASTIGRIPGLRVSAARSSFSLKGKNLSIPEIGKALGVSYLVDGSVQRGAGRLRIRAALLAAPTDSAIWTGEYDRAAGDVFAVQDEIARAIATELSVRLGGAANARIAKRSTTDAQAHEFYLRGRFFFQRRDSVSLRKAREYFNRAIARDSSYALAYSGLGDTYSHGSVFGYAPPVPSIPIATKYVDRALELDATLAEAHSSRGFIATFYEWDWKKAAQEFSRAVSLDPSYPSAHLWRAWYFVAADSMDSAVREVELALAMDPFALLTNTRLVSFLYYARRFNDALRQAQRAVELDSTFFQVNIERARVLGELRRCEEAVKVLESAPAQTAAVLRGIRGYTYAICGRRAEALAQLKDFDVKARRGEYVSHYARAVIHAGLGDKGGALRELESAYEERAWPMFLLAVDPAFDDLRDNPRFVSLARKVGLKALTSETLPTSVK